MGGPGARTGWEGPAASPWEELCRRAVWPVCVPSLDLESRHARVAGAACCERGEGKSGKREQAVRGSSPL